MPNHVINIIEPQEQAKNAIALFDSQEELASNNYEANNLVVYSKSEIVMDYREKKCSWLLDLN